MVRSIPIGVRPACSLVLSLSATGVPDFHAGRGRTVSILNRRPGHPFSVIFVSTFNSTNCLASETQVAMSSGFQSTMGKCDGYLRPSEIFLLRLPVRLHLLVKLRLKEKPPRNSHNVILC